ncbi:IclR family transcriptional regulator [Agrococcus carbonis]|uniref:DNA-binding transcriptional regulator, IclR family n=1 Tax=Agrococcus carbonis TaxID=684552 RepID=A0A1H1QM54_9MICO|nr:IclR family transcriptional regulator C-terminal domain-containing protein [Agrococcus carbonis]SDS24524.1 DNA-binding transcriptional regulator, IclR family [Agrococcus carbonis]
MGTPRMPAARSALRVLALLAEQPGPVRAATIARELALPRSSAYQLLQVMRDEGFLVHYPELGAWGASARVQQLGSRVAAATRLERLAQPLLDGLVRTAPVPVTSHLAVLAGSDVAYAGRGEGPRSPATVSRVGVRLPAVRTATGRAMLAALGDDQVRAIIPHDRDLAGERPGTRAALTRLLSAVRRRGWATEEGEVDAAYGSVAAAARDAAGYPSAAVGLTFRLAAIEPERWAELGAQCAAAAAELTRRLGG